MLGNIGIELLLATMVACWGGWFTILREPQKSRCHLLSQRPVLVVCVMRHYRTKVFWDAYKQIPFFHVLHICLYVMTVIMQGQKLTKSKGR